MKQFRIHVSIKEHCGSLGAKIRSREDFWFCCQSDDVARELASKNVCSKGYPHDEVLLQVLENVAV